jgi:hypothetical protein
VSPYAVLDLDDTLSYGPETITIYQQTAGVYRYSVHDFSNKDEITSSSALSNSGAQVKVYQGASLIATFNAPTSQEGTLWTVFEMAGGLIKPLNTMSYVSESSSVLAPSVNKIIEIDSLSLKNLPQK